MHLFVLCIFKTEKKNWPPLEIYEMKKCGATLVTGNNDNRNMIINCKNIKYFDYHFKFKIFGTMKKLYWYVFVKTFIIIFNYICNSF